MKPRMHHVDKVGAFLSREALHEKAIAFAEAEFDRRGKCPFVWALHIGDDLVWIETPWDSNREKVASVRMIRAMIKEYQARAYSHCVEAWVAAYKVAKDGVTPEKMPSEMPKDQRDDVLLVSTFDKNGGSNTTRYKVTVREHGYNFLGPRDDESFREDGGVQFSGLLFNLYRENWDDDEPVKPPRAD